MEFYANENLQGAPIDRRNVSVDAFIVNINVTVPMPETIDELAFNWGTGSALRVAEDEVKFELVLCSFIILV